MIWAVLAVLGIPLWLIAIGLLALMRGRSAVKRIPGSFACRARAASGETAGLRDRFPRYDHQAHWVHDVLVVHAGNPFLTRTLPLGVLALDGEPRAPDPLAKHVGKAADPLSVCYRLDSGAVIELICPSAEAARALGPFSAPAVSR